MANPVAAHTFDFVRVYLSTRDLAAPGLGTWSVPTKIFDGSGTPSKSTCQTFSAGALGPTDPNSGIIAQCTDDTTGGVQRLTWLGNGIPDTPRTITFAGSIAPIIGDDYWDISQGGWTYGSARYVALSNGTQVVIIKSTDDFATPAAIQDAANGPPSTTLGNLCALQRIDNKIYVFVASDNLGNFALWIFDLTINTWSGPTVVLAGSSIAHFGTSVDTFANGLYKFANGDILIIYSTGAAHNAAKCQLWAGGVWGPVLNLPGVNHANSAIDLGTEIIHIFTYDENDDRVHYSTYTHAGSFVTADIEVIPPTVGGTFDGVGHCSIQNGMLFVPRDDRADFDNSVWVATIPVSVPFQKELLPIPPEEANTIASFSINPGGTGYVLNDTGTINGGVILATYKVTGVHNNAIASISSGVLGTGYAIGDIIRINTGGADARLQVTSIGGGGSVAAVVFTNLGSGYSVSAGVSTTALSGVGVGFTVNILSLFNGVNAMTLTSAGAGYSVASGVGTTVGGAQPGVGTGLTIDVLSLIGVEPSCAYMMFPNGYQFSVDITLTFNLKGAPLEALVLVQPPPPPPPGPVVNPTECVNQE